MTSASQSPGGDSGASIAVGGVTFDAASIEHLFDTYPEAIAVHQGGRLLYLNLAGLNLIGASERDEVLGRQVMDFVHADSRELVAKRMAAVHGGQRGDPIRERFVRLDGIAVYVEVLALPVSIDGMPAAQLVIRDISRQLADERERERLLAQAETALHQLQRSDRALHLAEEATGLGVWDWNVRTNELWWTPGLEPLHGMEPGTFGGTFEDFTGAIVEEDRVGVRAAIQRAVTEGPDEFEVEFRVGLTDGGQRWVLGKGRVFRDAEGNAERMTGIGLDVSERRGLREELARTAESLRLVLDSLPSPVAYIDRERRYRLASKAHEVWMGRPLSELVGQPKARILGERQFAKIEEYVDRALSGETVSFEIDLVFPGLGPRFVRMACIPHVGGDGQVLGYVSLTTDLTERRRMEQHNELLAESGARLATELDVRATAMALARIVVPTFADQCAIDIFENGQLLRLAGILNAPGTGEADGPRLRPRREPNYAPTDPRNETLRDGLAQIFVHFDDAARRRFARDEEELELFRALNATSLIVAPVTFGNEVLGVITLSATDHSRVYDGHDLQTAVELGRRAGVAIANARLYEQSQHVSEALAAANRAKDEFLGLVSHELRNPLTTISGNASALLRDPGKRLSSDERTALEDMKAGADRLKGLVENMLVLSRLDGKQDVELEPLLVQRVIEDVVRRHAAQDPSRTFEVTAGNELPVVLGERVCVEQILDNLVSNATKYSPGPAPVTIGAGVEGDFLAVTVADRGPGIDDADLIFEPFHRAAASAAMAPGLGLGLTVCKRLVEVLGGTISVAPREGGGSAFTFTLPVLTTDE